MNAPAYPFSAVVGMADLRLALLVNAVSPTVGGVLVRGEKGTAKSTAVRALAALLPPVAVVAGCRFSCDPAAPDQDCPDGPHDAAGPAAIRPARLVELPVGASEDRVAGSLDLGRALGEGVEAFEPGLLAAAHRGVLYVDEVNLLHDHLVDLLLDAAALGTAYVEREGVSVRHAARFLLVGTMNPEEGELRPQLLDRFGLTVEVAATRDPVERAEVVRRRLAYESDPAGFAADWAAADTELAARIAAARARLPRVVLPDLALRQVTAVCAGFDVDGLRGDIVVAKTAMALAAWDGRAEVGTDDVRRAARLALPHRRRRNPFDAPGLDEQQLDDLLDEPPNDPDPQGPDGGSGGRGGARSDSPSGEGSDGPDPGGAAETSRPDSAGAGTASAGPPNAGSANENSASAKSASAGTPDADRASGPDSVQPAPASSAYPARRLEVPRTGTFPDAPVGRRSRARTRTGRTVGAHLPTGPVGGLHLPATIRAAAAAQPARARRAGGPLVLRRTDLREAVREGREGNLVLFCVDASGSMAARARMSAVKGAVLSLLLDAYQRRDKIGLVTFRGRTAEVLLPPTTSVEAGAMRLRQLPTGGRTPLAAGLTRAGEVLRAERLRDPRRRPLLVVVTDGRHTDGNDPLPAARSLARAGIATVVVDCESGPVRLGLAGRLAGELRGPALRLDELAADQLAGVVRRGRAAGPAGRAA